LKDAIKENIGDIKLGKSPYEMPSKNKWAWGPEGQSCEAACATVGKGWHCDEKTGEFGWPVQEQSFKHVSHVGGLDCNKTIAGPSCYSPTYTQGYCGWERDEKHCEDPCGSVPPPLTRRLCPCSKREESPHASNDHGAGNHGGGLRGGIPQFSDGGERVSDQPNGKFCTDESTQIFCTSDQEANGGTFRQHHVPEGEQTCHGICFPKDRCEDNFEQCAHDFIDDYYNEDRLAELPTCQDFSQTWCAVPILLQPISDAAARKALEGLIHDYDNDPEGAQFINDHRERLLDNIKFGWDPELDDQLPPLSLQQFPIPLEQSGRRLQKVNRTPTDPEFGVAVVNSSAPARRLDFDWSACVQAGFWFFGDAVALLYELAAGFKGLSLVFKDKRVLRHLDMSLWGAFARRFRSLEGAFFQVWKEGGMLNRATAIVNSFKDTIYLKDLIIDVNSALAERVASWISWWRWAFLVVSVTASIAASVASGGWYLISRIFLATAQIAGIVADVVDIEHACL